MKKIIYAGRQCCFLSNGTVELAVALDAGPRILKYAFLNGENILGDTPGLVIPTELGEWRALGGHRLWAAPEASPRSYAPDNDPVEIHEFSEIDVSFTGLVEAGTGLQKEIRVQVEEEGNGVAIQHRITNRSLWEIEISPWAITAMRAGGTAYFPQEPYKSWNEALLPARPLVLWHYTDLRDPRWAIGGKLVQLKNDAARKDPQKIGMLNKQGWAAYAWKDLLFMKKFPYQENETYPDYGCNNETYTAGNLIEVESLGPVRKLAPGGSVEHEEFWTLYGNFSPGKNEDEIDASLRKYSVDYGSMRSMTQDFPV
jgi:hypothetical protein